MLEETATKSDNAGREARASGRVVIAICLALVGLIVAVYGQTGTFEFTNFDDNVYLADNPDVREGLSRQSVRWAFVDFGNTLHGGNWHPLTWLSLMVDVELYGENAAGFHLTNVALHAINVLLLFTFLRRMTREVWPSAMVAALFAIHPLNVESVAWVAERKGMLSTMFFMLALLAYARYVRLGGIPRYLLVVVLFALGLMCKPVLVTFPFVLLLLDFWPFGRMASGAQRGADEVAARRDTFGIDLRRFGVLFAEKLPLLVMTAASCTTTFLSERMGGSMTSLESLSIAGRVGNSMMAYLVYLEKIFWPVDLAIPYPLEAEKISLGMTAFALVFMAIVTLGVLFVGLLTKRKHPWACVGWFWFVGVLVPVIKIVHVGREAYSDKFTYLPSIGIFLAIVFTLYFSLQGWRLRGPVLGALGSVVVVVLSVLTFQQASYWKDSITLFTHSISVTENNYTAHANRALAYQAAGEYAKALSDYDESVRIKPKFARVYINRGLVHRRLGNLEGAVNDFSVAIQLYRSAATGSAGLLGDGYYHRGNALRHLGKHKEAIVDYGEAIRVLPGHAKSYVRRAQSHETLGQIEAAMGDLREAIVIDRDNVNAHNGLARLLATSVDDRVRDGELALVHATRASELTAWKEYQTLDTLAAAHAEIADFAAALRWQEQAIALAPTGAKKALQANLVRYQEGKPLRSR